MQVTRKGEFILQPVDSHGLTGEIEMIHYGIIENNDYTVVKNLDIDGIMDTVEISFDLIDAENYLSNIKLFYEVPSRNISENINKKNIIGKITNLPVGHHKIIWLSKKDINFYAEDGDACEIRVFFEHITDIKNMDKNKNKKQNLWMPATISGGNGKLFQGKQDFLWHYKNDVNKEGLKRLKIVPYDSKQKGIPFFSEPFR